MSKLVYFMGGLPRSGSTLLAAILNQNKKIHVSTTSEIPEQIVALVNRNILKREDVQKEMYSLLSHKYRLHNFEFIVDKGRAWNAVFPDLMEKEKNPRLLAPIRPLKEVVASALRLFEKNPDNHFTRFTMNRDRDEKAMMFYDFYIKSSYGHIEKTLTQYPDNVLLINFHDLMYRPEKVINDVYGFCSFPYGEKHDFNNIKVRERENDKLWGIDGLHDVKPKLTPPTYTPENYYGKEISWFLDNADTINQHTGVIV